MNIHDMQVCACMHACVCGVRGGKSKLWVRKERDKGVNSSGQREARTQGAGSTDSDISAAITHQTPDTLVTSLPRCSFPPLLPTWFNLRPHSLYFNYIILSTSIHDGISRVNPSGWLLFFCKELKMSSSLKVTGKSRIAESDVWCSSKVHSVSLCFHPILW